MRGFGLLHIEATSSLKSANHHDIVHYIKTIRDVVCNTVKVRLNKCRYVTDALCPFRFQDEQEEHNADHVTGHSDQHTTEGTRLLQQGDPNAASGERRYVSTISGCFIS